MALSTGGAAEVRVEAVLLFLRDPVAITTRVHTPDVARRFVTVGTRLVIGVRWPLGAILSSPPRWFMGDSTN